MIITDLFESHQQCPECGGPAFSDLILAEKKDACYYKVKASAKVWPSAYASGRLVQCRKKGADNYGKSKNEGVAEGSEADAYGNTGEKHECGSCDGTGIVSYDELAKAAEYDDVCPECGGKGWVRDKESLKKKGVAEGSLEANTPNPVVVIQDLKGNILDTINLSVAVQKYNLGNPQNIKNQLAHQNYTTIGNYVVVSPMGGQPQDNTTQGVAEEQLDEKCWDGYQQQGTKNKGGRQVPNCVPTNEDSSQDCPPATQDIKLNLKNRQKAIDEYGYGPLNPDMPNRKFWMAKQAEWKLDSPEEAKQSLCGNCAAFDQRTDTLDCIAQGIGSDQGADDPTIDAGDLGYCRFLKFKCASRRTCDAWVTGGPLVDKPAVAEDQLAEKSVSQAQFRTMAAAAHNPKFAKKVGISPAVAKEFHGADRKQDYKDLPKKADEGKSAPKEKEADYGDDYQDMVARVKKLAGLGPLKTVYDPQKRVYRNVPTAVQPKK